MCGIIGIINTFGTRVDPLLLENCNTLMRHRGPNDEGYLLGSTRTGKYILAGGRDTDKNITLPLISQTMGDFDIGLGHRRLSILDLSVAGHQPMTDSQGNLVIVFNGEIFNYLEIKQELANLGYCFHSSSDTEVILAAYRQWGMESFNHFIGMWSLVIWDIKNELIVCSRDPLGIKPFYYSLYHNKFTFASEIKALLEISCVKRTLNAQRTFLFLRWGQTDFGGETMFSEISQLPPGCHLTISLKMQLIPKIIQYWEPYRGTNSTIKFKDAVAKAGDLFLENVKLHMRTDVPLGTALSGGLDSSALSCSMRKLGGSNLDLHTFSYLADEPKISEKQWIDLVNSRTDAIPHSISIKPNELYDDLDDLIYMQDEPFGSTRIYAQYRVYRKAKESGITVLLNGQGSDEIFGGYHYYLGSRMASLVKQGEWIKAVQFISNTGNLSGWNSMNTIAFGATQILPKSLQPFFRSFLKRELVPKWLNKDWFKKRNVDFSLSSPETGSECLKSALRQTLRSTSLPHLLRYEDRNSMTFSIESRVPFLTTKLIDFVLSLPEEFLISDNARTKYVFCEAIRGLVPDPVIDRTDKIGFETPEAEWANSFRDWGSDVLSINNLNNVPVFNGELLLSSIKESMSGHSYWRCLCFLKWCVKYKIIFE